MAIRLAPSLDLGGKLPTVCGTNSTTSPSSRSRTQPRVLAMRNSTGRSHRRGPRQPEQRRRDQLAQPAKRQHLGDQARGPRRQQQRPAANSQQCCCNSRPKFRPKQRPRRPHHGQGTHKCGKRSSRQSRCISLLSAWCKRSHTSQQKGQVIPSHLAIHSPSHPLLCPSPGQWLK